MDAARRDIQHLIMGSAPSVSVQIAGHGIRLRQFGLEQPQCEPLSTSHLTETLEVDPENMTVTADAGIAADQIAERLASHGLACDGLNFHSQDTLGGLIATNSRYWRQGYEGGWRDILVQMEWIDGRGRLLQFGTRTMKNVAGYDVPKLMIGSRGRLGVITQAPLRVRRQHPATDIGTIRDPSPSLLLALALALCASYNRPSGLILRQWDGVPEVLLLSVKSSQREWADTQAARFGKHVSWQESRDLADTVDRDRLSRAGDAARGAAFYEGGLPRPRLPELLQQLDSTDSFTLFPGTGAWEVYSSRSPGTALPGLTRQIIKGRSQIRAYQEWLRLTAKLERIWDPRGIFYSPWS